MTIPKTVFAEYQITKNTQAISVTVLFIRKTGKLKGFMQEKYLCFFPWGKGLLLLHMLFLESHVFISGAAFRSAGPHCEPSCKPGSWARLSICKAMAASHFLQSKQGKGRCASSQKGSEFAESTPVGNVKIHFQCSHCNSSSDAARVPTERTLSV